MLPEDRHLQILKELAFHGSLSVEEFAARMGTSGMTVRRDLAALAEQGLLQRVRGGAVPVAGTAIESGRGAATGMIRRGHSGPSGVPPVSGRPGGRRPLATIGMIVPSASYYFPGVIRGAEAAAQEAGVRLVLGVSNYSGAEERRQLRRLFEHGVDGILVTPSEVSLAGTETLALLAEAAVPVVVVERSIDDISEECRLESVRSDHVRGAEIAVNHLLSIGHRRIALCVREKTPTTSQVIEGYHLAMRRAGTPQDSTMVRPVSRALNDPQAHRLVLDGILDWCAESHVTAAIVHSDEDALQFASACQDRRVRIPEDLAIIAYDDEIAALGTVPLTAVAPPKYDVGHEALLMCLNRIGAQRRGVSALQRLSLSPSLNIRDSTQSQALHVGATG